jgi:hypothetical protein
VLRIQIALLPLSMAALWISPAAQATPWPHPLPTHHFVGLTQGGDLSNVVQQLRGQGFENSDGRVTEFNKWYRTSWPDLKLTWMTQLTPQSGILWGFSTGERGPKYKIASSLQLGFLHNRTLSNQSQLTLRISQRFGGRLTEKSCQAFYAIDNQWQEVNCRLAAGELPPADTLQYLYRQKPRDSRASISVAWQYPFR